ncbi:imelysin family protein [Bradymonas sediminis]|nr:imelysin family protein [Bradymonas sediminis]TDP72202.1 putative lipoprotein [Bradymonas sediminis]
MRNTRSLILSLITGLVLAVGFSAACSDDNSGNAVTQEDPKAAEARRDVLANLGENVIFATYVEFEQKVQVLQTKTDAYAASLDSADHEAAKVAWSDAMQVWQRAEMFQVGPAGAMGAAVAGEDLRDQIYSWPLTNGCRVDQEVVEKDYADPTAFASEAINVRGLDALEYLLFNAGTENACTPQSTINTDGSWSALDESELTKRRAEYAHTLAIDLNRSATTLREMWDPQEGNFLAEFSTAGAGSKTFMTSQEALNAVSDAMFYLDKEVKDMKLARPAGLSECVDDVCPDKRESPWADQSLDHVRQNLVAFQLLFSGGDANDPDAPGFDDLIRGMGVEQLADDMNTRIAAALAAIDAVEGTMVEALADDPQSVVDVFDATKAITDLYKSQFFDVLDLEVPNRGEGDND